LYYTHLIISNGVNPANELCKITFPKFSVKPFLAKPLSDHLSDLTTHTRQSRQGKGHGGFLVVPSQAQPHTWLGSAVAPSLWGWQGWDEHTPCPGAPRPSASVPSDRRPLCRQTTTGSSLCALKALLPGSWRASWSTRLQPECQGPPRHAALAVPCCSEWCGQPQGPREGQQNCTAMSSLRVRPWVLATSDGGKGSRGSWQLGVEQGVPLLPAPHPHTLATALVLGQHGVRCPSQNATAAGLGWVRAARRDLCPTGSPGAAMQPGRGSASWPSLPDPLQHPSSSLQHLGTACDAVGPSTGE